MRILREFTATDNYPQAPSEIRVLVYFAYHCNRYVVDIQSKANDGSWREDHDPFRSAVLADCIEYYEELKVSEDYSNVKEIVG